MELKIYEAPANDAVYRSFAQLERNLRDSRKALQAAGNDYLQTIQIRHDSQSWQMKPWPALSEPYATRKAKKYPGTRILEATRTMRNSYYCDVNRNILKVGNTTDYWQYHEHLPQNAALDKGKMPIRRTATPTPYNLVRMTKIIAAQILPRNMQDFANISGRGFGGRETP